jgi:sec-independent protein translocase protein TatB
MNFMGIGPLELALVVIIGVIVLGPERIPEVAVQVARAIRYLRSYATDATADMRKELDELTRDYEDVRKELQSFRESVSKDVASVSDQVSKVIEESLVEASGDPPHARKNGSAASTAQDEPKKPVGDDSA